MIKYRGNYRPDLRLQERTWSHYWLESFPGSANVRAKDDKTAYVIEVSETKRPELEDENAPLDRVFSLGGPWPSGSTNLQN